MEILQLSPAPELPRGAEAIPGTIFGHMGGEVVVPFASTNLPSLKVVFVHVLMEGWIT